MANENATAGDLNYADTLWKSADALRGQVDAAEYKHVVLGLLFLRYIFNSFESRREDLRPELTTRTSRASSLAHTCHTANERIDRNLEELPADRFVGNQHPIRRSKGAR